MWVIGGAFVGPACLLRAPMDGVPYPQPLTGHEPQYVSWGVRRVRPIGHPPGPVPPWAAGLQSQVYPALLHTVTGGGGGGATPQVKFLAGAPQWGLGACCLVGVVPFAYGVCCSCPPFPCPCTLILVAPPRGGGGGGHFARQ